MIYMVETRASELGMLVMNGVVSIAFLDPRRPSHMRHSSGSHTPGSRYEAGSPRNPFPGPGSQFRPRHEAAASVHTSPDALLNGALVASAERMHRVREQLQLQD